MSDDPRSHHANRLGDLRRLAEEAAHEATDVRAKRCWFGVHAWTMWQPLGDGLYWQRRRCLRCNLVKDKAT